MIPVLSIERISRTSSNDIDVDGLKRKSWHGFTAEVVRYSHTEPYDFRFASNASYLALLNIQRRHGETQLTALPRNTRKDLRNRVTFVPATCELSGWSELARPASVTALYFDPASDDDAELATGRGAMPELSQLAPMASFEDQMLRAALLQFQALVADPALDTPGYAETLGLLVAFELCRCNKRQPELQQGGLTTRQVRLVLEYLEHHITDETTVAELAALVDLSRFHFIRAFKKTVGMPPHQYLIHLRVERAKELLADDALSVGDIADQSGFKSTTQLTRSFRRIAGVTPTTYRREIS